MSEKTELTITEKVEQFESQGWKYIHDGKDWSSGVWYHEELGCVNSGGGSFSWIGKAIKALENFNKSLEMCS